MINGLRKSSCKNQKSKKMNVLLTAIGSMSALCAINKLHETGHKVIGCDIYPKEWHYEASLCDVFQQAPYANTDEYVPFLIQLAKDNNVDYIFPLTDLEIDVLRANRDKFINEGITICMSPEETLKVARNKYALFETFKEDANVPSIPTFTLEDNLSKLKFPCVAKPRGGRSSEGLCFLHDKSQLDGIKNVSSYIFQEKIEGRVCTVDYVRNPKDGKSFCVPREELLRTKNGAGTTVRIFQDEKLERLVKYIGEKLGICGVVNMEFINNGNNFYLIDINPRFSAGIAFSCKTGYDFVNAHLACFNGKVIPEPVEFNEHIEIKYFIER